MSQKFHKTKTFLELDKEWKKKLKDSGFNDIEDESENIDRGSWDFRTTKVMNSFNTKSEYYYRATQFLNDYNFDTALDKTVWMYHAEAIGVRDISKLLIKLKICKLRHVSIFNIVTRLNREMKGFYGNTQHE